MARAKIIYINPPPVNWLKAGPICAAIGITFAVGFEQLTTSPKMSTPSGSSRQPISSESAKEPRTTAGPMSSARRSGESAW